MATAAVKTIRRPYRVRMTLLRQQRGDFLAVVVQNLRVVTHVREPNRARPIDNKRARHSADTERPRRDPLRIERYWHPMRMFRKKCIGVTSIFVYVDGQHFESF